MRDALPLSYRRPGRCRRIEKVIGSNSAGAMLKVCVYLREDPAQEC